MMTQTKCQRTEGHQEDGEPPVRAQRGAVLAENQVKSCLCYYLKERERKNMNVGVHRMFLIIPVIL